MSRLQPSGSSYALSMISIFNHRRGYSFIGRLRLQFIRNVSSLTDRVDFSLDLEILLSLVTFFFGIEVS